jgi:hypothetical protein
MPASYDQLNRFSTNSKHAVRLVKRGMVLQRFVRERPSPSGEALILSSRRYKKTKLLESASVALTTLVEHVRTPTVLLSGTCLTEPPCARAALFFCTRRGSEKQKRRP